MVHQEREVRGEVSELVEVDPRARSVLASLVHRSVASLLRELDRGSVLAVSLALELLCGELGLARGTGHAGVDVAPCAASGEIEEHACAFQETAHRWCVAVDDLESGAAGVEHVLVERAEIFGRAGGELHETECTTSFERGQLLARSKDATRTR